MKWRRFKSPKKRHRLTFCVKCGDNNTGTPDIAAIMQSGNLYVYCMGNPVILVDPTGFAGELYIIYDVNGQAGTRGKMFKDEANIVEENAEGLGMTVHSIGVSTAKEFEEVWNSMPDGVSVYLIFHGTIVREKGNAVSQMYLSETGGGAIYAREGIGNPDTDVYINKLQYREIHALTFSSCNTANPDVYNLAYAFMVDHNVSQIIGFDGGSFYDYKERKLIAGAAGTPQGTFDNYNTTGRRRIGKRVFSKYNGSWVEGPRNYPA